MLLWVYGKIGPPACFQTRPLTIWEMACRVTPNSIARLSSVAPLKRLCLISTTFSTVKTGLSQAARPVGFFDFGASRRNFAW